MLTRNRLFVVCFSLTSLLVFTWVFHTSHSVQTAYAMQIPIYTPTPGPDGKIIYIVKKNDTLLSISLTFGIPVDKLRTLNNLSGDRINEGQKLILGLAGPAEISPTPGQIPTATGVQPTPTPKIGVGVLCIILFNDRNGDSIRQADEPSIPGGAISVANRSGSVSITANTEAGDTPYCIDKVLEGDYTISVATPSGYNPTTSNTYQIAMGMGDTTYVDFGAQASSNTPVEAPILPPEGQRSPLLGIVGGIFLVGSLLLALFAGRSLRNK